MRCGRLCCFCGEDPCGGSFPRTRNGIEVELTPDDLDRIRFFPRAQWRRAAEGSFYMKDVVERMRPKLEEVTDDEFFRKLQTAEPVGGGTI